MRQPSYQVGHGKEVLDENPLPAGVDVHGVHQESAALVDADSALAWQPHLLQEVLDPYPIVIRHGGSIDLSLQVAHVVDAVAGHPPHLVSGQLRAVVDKGPEHLHQASRT